MMFKARLPFLAALLASSSAFSVVKNQRWSVRSSSGLFASVEEKPTMKPLGKPGTAKMDVPWEDLGFEFRPTNSNVRMTYKDGKWGEMELVKVRNRLFHSFSFATSRSMHCARSTPNYLLLLMHDAHSPHRNIRSRT